LDEPPARLRFADSLAMYDIRAAEARAMVVAATDLLVDGADG